MGSFTEGIVMRKLITSLMDFVEDEDGQAITEYAAVLAFVSLIVAFVFGIANGSLFVAISQSYSSVSGELSRLNNYTATT